MPEIRHVDANGLRFAYLEEGRGPLVLLFHGFPDTARSWDAIRPQIAAKGYRAVSPWTRGYAPTQIPDRDADLETLARDQLALITALGAESAIVIAHDWGAAAAYAAASLEPERISKLVTIGIPHPATLRPSPIKVWRVRHFFAYKRRGAARRFARDDFAALPAICKRWSPTWAPADDEFTAVRESFSDPASLDAAMGYYRELRFRPQKFLRTKISVPTVVFSGADDPIATLSDYNRASRMFTADYTVEQIPGGHFMHREHPTDFAAKLLPHL
ncbi:MAG TPA: alpha/beta hydrolase [Kofleriaceae bacterium]|nr:alpha/beta hydrolase [Kofleriaceae bacterium]